jgi:hypothetical protein
MKLNKKQIKELEKIGWKVRPEGFWFGFDFDSKKPLSSIVDNCNLPIDEGTKGYDFVCFGFKRESEVNNG